MNAESSRNSSLKDEPPHGDCYSQGERAWMEYGQHLRAVALGPALRLLTRFRIGPDHVTVLSLLAGLAFAVAWPLGYRWSALFGLAMHVLLDGLDGPLARQQRVDSPRGSFTDSFCDQLVVSAVVIVLMIGPDPMLDVVSGGIFLVLYTAVLAISMVRNSLAIPYSWLVRPRFFVYLAIPIELLFWPNLVVIVVIISNALLTIKLVSGFFQLRKAIRGRDELGS